MDSEIGIMPDTGISQWEGELLVAKEVSLAEDKHGRMIRLIFLVTTGFVGIAFFFFLIAKRRKEEEEEEQNIDIME